MIDRRAEPAVRRSPPSRPRRGLPAPEPARPGRRRPAGGARAGRAQADHRGLFSLVFAIIAGKTAYLAAGADGSAGRRGAPSEAMASVRPDILDRNGEMLATDVKTASLFAEPRRIIDIDEALELLSAVLPDLDMRARCASGCRPRTRLRLAQARDHAAQQQAQIHRLGIPGIGFLRENKRVYPAGAVAGHVLGHVNIDNQGIAGIEKWVDSSGLAFLHQVGLATDRAAEAGRALARPARPARDARRADAGARTKFKAKAASGAILDVNTGEVVAMVSLPDYDPNKPVDLDRTT